MEGLLLLLQQQLLLLILLLLLTWRYVQVVCDHKYTRHHIFSQTFQIQISYFSREGRPTRGCWFSRNFGCAGFSKHMRRGLNLLNRGFELIFVRKYDDSCIHPVHRHIASSPHVTAPHTITA